MSLSPAADHPKAAPPHPTVPPARPRRPRTAWKAWVSLAVIAAITYWAGSAKWGIAVDLSAVVKNFANGYDKFVQLLQPSFKHFSETLGPMLQSLETALVASVIGCAIGLPVAFAASRITMPNAWIRGPVRGLLSIIRAIPDILYASILATILGVGPLAGVIALVLFAVGILVKLLAEVIDAVDTGPFEAAMSTGATRSRASRASILPQVLPNYAAFSLYILELNIRTGTVLGLVGAGGIGQLLNDWRIYYRYHDVSLIILEILVVVLALEIISAALRRRLS